MGAGTLGTVEFEYSLVSRAHYQWISSTTHTMLLKVFISSDVSILMKQNQVG